MDNIELSSDDHVEKYTVIPGSECSVSQHEVGEEWLSVASYLTWKEVLRARVYFCSILSASMTKIVTP
jgi:hypothetical protein